MFLLVSRRFLQAKYHLTSVKKEDRMPVLDEVLQSDIIYSVRSDGSLVIATFVPLEGVEREKAGQAKAILFSFIASFDANQRKELEEQL
jgi:hypothetical protein